MCPSSCVWCGSELTIWVGWGDAGVYGDWEVFDEHASVGAEGVGGGCGEDVQYAYSGCVVDFVSGEYDPYAD